MRMAHTDATRATDLKKAYRNRNSTTSKTYMAPPDDFKESYVEYQAPMKVRGVAVGDPPIRYIIHKHVKWYPELWFDSHYGRGNKYVRCTCGCKLRARGDIFCVAISLEGPLVGPKLDDLLDQS